MAGEADMDNLMGEGGWKSGTRPKAGWNSTKQAMAFIH